LILTGVIGATSAPTYAAGPLGPLSTRQQTPTATPPPGPGCSDIPHAGDLRAVITDHPDSTTALFTNRSNTCSYRIGLAIYKKFDENIDHQELYDNVAATIPPNSTLELGVSNPPCAYQADAFWGEVLQSLAGGVRYGPRRLADTEGGTEYCQAVQPSATPSATGTPVAPTPTATSAPPTETSVPPTETTVPPTETTVPPTETTVPPTETAVPPTETAVPPTETTVPPTATAVPPTDTPVPPTATATETPVPPTETAVPPTETPTQTPAPPAVVPPSTAVPTDTPWPPGGIVVPTGTPAPPVVGVVATNTPAPPAGTVARPTSPQNRPPAPTTSAGAPAPQSRTLPLVGSNEGPQVLPLTGGADGLSLVPVLMAGLLLSMIGVVLRRRAAPRR
jgi:hypothetical protein